MRVFKEGHAIPRVFGRLCLFDSSLIDLYEATFEIEWLKNARPEWKDDSNNLDEKNGGFSSPEGE